MPIGSTRTRCVIEYVIAISLVAFVLIEVAHLLCFRHSRYRAELQREMLSEIRNASALVRPGDSLEELTTKFRASKLYELTKDEVDALPYRRRGRWSVHDGTQNSPLDWKVYEIDGLVGMYCGSLEVGIDNGKVSAVRIVYELTEEVP